MNYAHLPTEDKSLYEREYFDQYYINDKKREEMYRQEYKRILQRTKPGRVLDVGCGVGGFLSLFDDRWERYGYEPSEWAAARAKQKGITMVHDLSFFDLGSIDVIIFRGTLQHINYPMKSLVHATQLLRKGGLLVVLATPDTDSLVYKIWGNLPALDAPRNWIVFGSRVLANILRRLGMEDIEVLHPYLGTPYASPLKDLSKFVVSLFFGWRKFAFPGNQFELYCRKK
jgi:SAM-dependent methyltransferase